MNKIFRYVLCIMMTCMIICGLSIEVIASEEKNTIAVVYDDSGSMMYDSNQDKIVDRWCHAKYALEVFSTMMLEDDVITVYPMNHTGAGFTMNGSDDAEQRRQQVENFEIIYGGYTPYSSVQNAYSKISAVNDGSTRWLVVITDGDFGSMDYSDVNSNFEDYASSGVNVVYLRIYDNETAATISNDRASKVIDQPDKNIYVYEAMKSKDTLERVNEISNLIFKRQALSKYPGVISKTGNGLTVELDVPVSQLVVFAQGDHIQVGEITGPKSVKRVSAINVKTPEIPDNTGGIPKDQMLVADGLGGVVATYISSDQAYLPSGTYTLDISNTDNVEIYCKLAVSVEILITQNGRTIDDSDNIFVGDYEMDVVLRDPEGNILDSSAKLLSDAQYEITVTNTYIDENGEEQTEEKLFTEDSFQDSVLQGEVTLDGKIKLGDSYVPVHKTYGVVPELFELEIQCTVPEEGINFEELDQKATAITVKILEGGEPLKENQLENLEFKVSSDKKIDFEVVQGSEAGVFLLYPIYQGSIENSDSGMIPFKLEASLEMDGQKKSAVSDQMVELYVNLIPIDISFTVPVPEKKKENGYRINELSYVEKGSDVQAVVLDDEFNCILAECKLDGRDFTKEEWETVKVEAYLVDVETGERIEHDKFSVRYEKGSGENCSKVLIAPVSHVKNIFWYLFAKDLAVELNLEYDYLGSICKDTGRTDFKIYTAGIGLVIHWLPILAAIAAGCWLLWSMTAGKCWNRPKPEFVIKRWSYQTGDAPEIVKSANVHVHSYASLAPGKPLIWRISSGDGMPNVVLEATRNGYTVLNPEELIKKKVQKNFTEIQPNTKKISISNTGKLSVRTKDTSREKVDTILYLHKRKRKKRNTKAKKKK